MNAPTIFRSVMILMSVISATPSIAAPPDGKSSLPATQEQARELSASNMRRSWISEVNPGRDARTIYEQMLAHPEAGGGLFASEIESLCANVSLRTDVRNERIHSQDTNSPTYGKHQQLKERLRVTCASILPGEATFESVGARMNNKVLRQRDPLLSLSHQLSSRDSSVRRLAIERAVKLGPPANLLLLDRVMMRSPEKNTYFLFDGVKYYVAAAEGNPLSGRSDQLIAALNLAACDLGYRCDGNSLIAARHCLLRHVDCNEPDFPSMVYAALRGGEYTDLEIGLQGIEPLRRRLVAAISSKDVAAFLNESRKAD